MLENLEKHHIGIVVEETDIPAIEEKVGKKFHVDEQQGVRVIFEYDDFAKLYNEYIVREGRAKNYELGFNHLCLNVKNKAHLDEVHGYLMEKKIAFRLTFPEKSGSEECGFVAFYKHKDLGIVEFNVLDYEDFK